MEGETVNHGGTFMFQFGVSILQFLLTGMSILDLFNILSKGGFLVNYHPQTSICKEHIHCIVHFDRKNQKLMLFERIVNRLLGPNITDKIGLKAHLKNIVIHIDLSMVENVGRCVFGYDNAQSNVESIKEENADSVTKALYHFWKKRKEEGKELNPANCLEIFNFKDMKTAKEARELLINSGTISSQYFQKDDDIDLEQQGDESQAIR